MQGGESQGPTIFANRSPIDVPDDFPGVVPEFKSRRGPEALPKLRPAERPKGFGPTLAVSGWYGGFLCGVMASVGGAAIVVILFRGLA